MPVITRLPLCFRPASGLRPGHADARTDQLAGVSVGHQWVGKDVEHLVEQPSAINLDACAFDHVLRELIPGA